MRSLFYCGIIVSFFAYSHADANNLVIVLRTEDTVFIAADSKISKISGRDIGSACKIHITDQLVWATAGIANDPLSTFDTWAIAEAAIKAGGSLDEIVSRFDRDFSSQLKELLSRTKRNDPQSYGKVVESGHPVDIVFIKNVELRMSDFMLPNKDIPERIEVMDYSCPGDLCVSNPQIITMIGYSDAARIEKERNPEIWNQMGIVPALNRLMDIQHNATPRMVAGPVSILQIGCAHRAIATSYSDLSGPAVTIDRDHRFRAIATSLWTGVMGAVG